MRPEIDGTLKRLQRRASLAAWLGEGSHHLLVAALAAGSAVLLARLLVDLPTARAALFLGLVALVPLTAWQRARSRFLSREGAATWLDLRSGATGTLVTALEVGDERWAERTREVLARAPEVPGLRLAPAVGRAATGVGFALLALLVPIPRTIAGPPPAIFDASLEALQEKLATLEEEIVFDEETAQELEERMERLEKEALASENPEATFEAIDEMTKRLEEEALEAQEAIETASESLAIASSFAEENPALAEEKMNEAIEKLAKEGLTAALPEDLAELDLDALGLPEGFELDPEKIAELSEEMQELLKEMLEHLGEAGLLDLEGLEWGEFGELGEIGDLSELEFEVCEDCKNGEP
ncbi:MAG: hypothetical protein GY711_03245 [bacterium]|nr:hypothetical protein [bacterium]